VGQSWWWVVLGVVVVAVVVVLAVVTLLRGRRRRAGGMPPSDVEIAAAAAGGAAGAVGAGGVAAILAEEKAPEPTDVSDPAAEPPAEGNGPAPTPSIPAPREEQPLSGGWAESRESRPPEQRTPEPAGSALAALDSGLIGAATPFAAAAAAVSAAAARPGPYPGSLLPAADGSAPTPDHTVKANEGSRRYHTPDSPFYLRTRGDAWFRTADEARAAGFTAWDA
jgi:hypothetical protein